MAQVCMLLCCHLDSKQWKEKSDLQTFFEQKIAVGLAVEYQSSWFGVFEGKIVCVFESKG